MKVPKAVKLNVRHPGVAPIRDFGDSLCFKLVSMTTKRVQKFKSDA